MKKAIKIEVESIEDQLEDILETGKELFIKATDSWQKNRQEALADLKFYSGDQWTAELNRNGTASAEPTLTVNRLPQFVKQIENALQKQQISINVYPTDEQGSEDTAQIFSGIIRDIERKSYAQSQYIHAAGECGAMVPGFGFLKLDTKYTGSRGFNQEIRIVSPIDPFKILPDGDSVEPDGSDAQFWFEFDDYSTDAYTRAFPNSKITTSDLSSPGAAMSKWVGTNGIRVVKYWYKEELEAIEYLMDDGSVTINQGIYNPNDTEEEERGPDFDGSDDSGITNEKVILRSRNVIQTKIKWVIFNGVEILDKGEWADDEFPFVSIYGPTLIVDGEKQTRGIIHFAKEPQKMLNYMASTVAKRIGSANKAPWIADIKAIKGYENQWKTANTTSWSVLPYNSIDPDNPNRPLAPPVRADQTGQINDALAAAIKYENDMKACLGIYDAGLGATPNDQSGVAIKTLAEQGQNSNAHFSDALQRGIQRLGYLLIKLIPKIYDTPRAIRIIGADNTEELVKINQIFMENGIQKEYNLGSGEYGVSISAGPAYATKKSQSLDQITRLLAGDKEVLPLIQDILVGEMDFDKAGVIQARLKKYLMMKQPGIVDEGPMKDVPPQLQAAMTQSQEMIHKLVDELQSTHAELQQLQMEKATKTLEHQFKMEEIAAKTQSEVVIQETRAKFEQQQNHDQLDAAMVAARMKYTHEHQKTLMDLHTERNILEQINPIGPDEIQGM